MLKKFLHTLKLKLRKIRSIHLVLAFCYLYSAYLLMGLMFYIWHYLQRKF